MTTIRIIFLALILPFFQSNSFAQTTTYITDVTGDIFVVDLTGCTTTLFSTGNTIFTDIAYCSLTNTIYGLDEFGGIYAVNATTGGSTTYVGSVVALGNNTGMVALTCDENGLLYVAAYNTSYPGGFLYSYNPLTNSTTNLGNLPSFVEPAGDLTYFNGQLVMSSYNNEIYEINISAPSFSTLIHTYSSTIDAFGITSMNCGQDLILSSGDQLFVLDTATSQTTLLCTLPAIAFEINGATSTGELPMDLDIGQDTSICGTFSLTLDAQNPSSSYLWSNGSTGQTLQVTSPGTYWVEVTNGTCSSSDTIIISPIPGPIVDLGADTTLCGGSTITLDAQNTGSSFIWNDNSSNQTLVVNSPGLFFVSVTSGSCTSVDSILVSYDVNPLDLGPDTEICSGITLDAGNSGTTYLWNNGSTGQTLYADSVGTYWVDLTTAYCTYSDTIELSLGSISTGLPNNMALCQGSGALILDAQNPGGDYVWQDGSTNQLYTVNSEGEYWVTVTLGWCETTDTIDVIISNPLADFSVIDTIGCGQIVTSFFDQSLSLNDPIAFWNWDFGDGTSSSEQNPTHVYPASGIYTTTLTVITAGGCQHTYTRTVEISAFPPPQATFSYSPLDPQVGQTIIFVDESSQVYNWFWDFGNGSSSDLQNPEYVYDSEGDYTVTLVVTDINGCSDSSKITINFSKDIIVYVPNSFTPNGDEFNNTFYPVFGSEIDEINFHLVVYSRWGEVVYESYDSTQRWDGTFNGGMVQDGVYTWVVTFDWKDNAQRKILRGHVNIVR